MRPGDLATCRECGATAVAAWRSAERPWQEGWPLSFAWTHGPFPRTEAAARLPTLCLFCNDVALGYPSALNRPTEGVPALVGVKLTRPPASREGWEEIRPAPAEAAPAGRAPSPAGPLERYEELAAAFHRETGFLAPGKDAPAAAGGFPSEEERRERWRAWCAARAAAAAPKRPPPKPKGQLSLL